MRPIDRAAAALAVVAWVVVGSLVALPAVAVDDPATQPAVAVVRTTVDEILGVLAQADLSVDDRVARIERVAYARFDFATISRLVLARSYRKFTPEQIVEFEEGFKEHLSRSYGTRVDRYEQEEVEIIGARVESRGDVTVLTRIVGGQASGIEMNYRLRKRDGEWLVIDVVIEGVSLVRNFRTQFKEVISDGGPELLLAKLRDKNNTFEFETP